MKDQLKKTVFELKEQIQKKGHAETVFFKPKSELLHNHANKQKEIEIPVETDPGLKTKCRIDVIICFKGFVFENDDQRIS